MNRRGPSVEPLGTPIFTSKEQERCWLISTNQPIKIDKNFRNRQIMMNSKRIIKAAGVNLRLTLK